MQVELRTLATRVRHACLVSTTAAGSGHPTSSLSAADLLVGLLFGGVFRADLTQPEYPSNDRLIVSKGHASPLLYALYAAAGKVSEKELLSLRDFGSRLEGHPTLAFPYTEAATGSLGQGLSIGVGLAMNAKYLDRLPYRTYVLLGDSEMSEGSVWEAIQLAAHYTLDNLVGILDVNRLGQRGETLYGHDLRAYARRIKAFGWHTLVIDGHDFQQIIRAYRGAQRVHGAPTMIVAKTLKGKGVSFVEDKNGWHGKALSNEELGRALEELGPADVSVRGRVAVPGRNSPARVRRTAARPVQRPPGGKPLATRKAYGNALVRIAPAFPELVVLDAEVGNSTFAETFQKAYPDRFFEMFIAEQNMVGVAVGLARRGKIPFVSSFAAFLTRAADQIRMAQYSNANVKFCGSHAGVSIGEDGASQMGLEDIALFRAIQHCVVLCPSDAVATEHLVESAAGHRGMVYLRTTRMDTPILYNPRERFSIGGSKVLRRSAKDKITLVGAGVTLHEALAAAETLKDDGVAARVIDLYSIKPVDTATLHRAASDTGRLLTIEDHVPEGGLGEAVRSALADGRVPVYSLAVRKMPRSGTPAELLEDQGIGRRAIIRMVRKLL